MKKTLLFIAALLTASVSFAQREVGKVSFTASAGLSLADLTNSHGYSSMRPGIVIGGQVMYQETPVIALSAGLYYSQQGCKADGSLAGESRDIDVTMRNDYINIPLLVNAYVTKGLALKAGIQPGYLVSADVHASYDGNTATKSVMSAYKRFDFSIPVGVSYETGKVVVDARYNIGITNIGKDVSDDDNSKNKVFQLTVGYRF
ncbi:MAG: PorT family protein [Bacteroidaceae bacterium]|nr:PorT family protein [Bacteroidaceae bacterium]